MQDGDMCSRHACVRATEYRKRIQVARAHQRRYIAPDKTIQRPVDESDNSESDPPVNSVYPMKLKRVLKLKWRGRLFSLGNFRRLSVQQVVDNARDTNDPYFKTKLPLKPTMVLGYIRDNGVTFEKYYPTIEGKEEPEPESEEFGETETEHVEGEEGFDSETQKFYGEKTNVDSWNIGGLFAETGEFTKECESHAEDSLYVDNYEGERQEVEVDAVDTHADVESESCVWESEGKTKTCQEVEEDVVDGDADVETESGVWESKGKTKTCQGVEEDVVDADADGETDSVWESEGKTKTWQVQKRLYIKGFTSLYLEPGKLEKFAKLVVHHCREDGPVIGLVTCCNNFEKLFHSKKGYDFIRKNKTEGTDVDQKGTLMVDIMDDDHTSSTDSAELGVAAHCVTIIGDGTMRRRLVWTRLHRRGWKNKRPFFLVQDSCVRDAGAFRNGLAIVFASSVFQVCVPYV